MKKAISSVLALGMSLSMLTACGGAASSSTAASTAGSATTATSASALPEAGTLSGTIRYASMWNETEAQADVIKAAIEEFTTIYPDVEITVDWLGRDVRKTIQASLDAGQVDLWDSPLDAVLPNYADYGYDLTELMAAENPVLDGKTYNDLANPTLMEAVKSAGGNDQILAVPYTPTVIGMFYNKDQFAEAGITEEPQTWEEFLDVCEKLKAAGFTPLSVDDGYVVLPFASYIGRLKGLDFVDQLISDPEGTPWDDPAVKEAAEAMQELWDKGYMSANSASNKYPAGQNEVAMGNATMYLVGSYMLNEVVSIAGEDFNWGCFAFPAPEGSVNGVDVNTIGMQALQVAKNATDPELAFYFATFFTTGKYDEMMSQQTNSIPTATDTEWPVMLECAKPVLNSTKVNVPYGFGIQYNADFTPIYKELAQKLLGGQTDAATFIAECKAAVTGK